MATSPETLAALRNAAEGGDADAARELGRLLSLVRVAPEDDPHDPDVVQSWPEERWLRMALRARPGDTLAATLLAGRLVQQIGFWRIDPDIAADHGEDDTTLARRRDEARGLYARVLASRPDDPAAKAGLAVLEASFDDSGELPGFPVPYSYYELRLDLMSGSFSHAEIVVVTGIDDLRWAYDNMLRPFDDDTLPGDPVLETYTDGEPADLLVLKDRVALDDVAIPPLTGTPLPPGHPVQEGLAHYGYSCDWG
ncbi:hypothetical protein [Actinomadura kijaniata]|uniref:hypothetical protein n=1 Tax=Actinomadura kijaniata TaxID=46161 RepID=UPI00083241CD|nr:hypothetical protein [Actinomadura kijaniata]